MPRRYSYHQPRHGKMVAATGSAGASINDDFGFPSAPIDADRGRQVHWRGRRRRCASHAREAGGGARAVSTLDTNWNC